MKIVKLTYSRSDLEALTEDQLSTFLLLGLFINEVNWLQKLLYITSKQRAASEAERDGRLSLSIMISKLLAAKLHEGWNRMNNQPVKDSLDALPTNDKIMTLHSELESRLEKDSVIHSIRNGHAFHYPIKLSLTGLPNITQEEIAIYMTDNLGDVLSLVSDLSSVAEMLQSTSKDDLDSVLKEVYKTTNIYSQYIEEILSIYVNEIIKTKGETKTISLDSPVAADEVELSFFMDIK